MLSSTFAVRIGIKSRLERLKKSAVCPERITGKYQAMQVNFAKIISAIGNKPSVLHRDKRKGSWRTSQEWSGT
jgi:hypothetical protein